MKDGGEFVSSFESGHPLFIAFFLVKLKARGRASYNDVT